MACSSLLLPFPLFPPSLPELHLPLSVVPLSSLCIPSLPPPFTTPPPLGLLSLPLFLSLAHLAVSGVTWLWQWRILGNHQAAILLAPQLGPLSYQTNRLSAASWLYKQAAALNRTGPRPVTVTNTLPASPSPVPPHTAVYTHSCLPHVPPHSMRKRRGRKEGGGGYIAQKNKIQEKDLPGIPP